MRPISSCPSCRRTLLSSFNFFLARQKPYQRSYIRPSTAPKPALDLKHIRKNPGLYEQNCVDRNYPAQARNSWRILELFNDWRACQEEAKAMRKRNNELIAKLGRVAVKRKNAEADEATGVESEPEELKQEAKQLKVAIGAIEEREKAYQLQMEELALELPNLSSTNTPIGDVPDILEYIIRDPSSGSSDLDVMVPRHTRSHVDIGTALDILDFSSAATTSGWGFYFLKGAGALLETALVQHALSIATAAGFALVSPPSLVYSHMAAACGFQPRDSNGEKQIYAIEEKDPSKPSLVLAGTAEIPLAAMNAGKTLTDAELPLKLVGVSRSYRAEAGARGADTKGLYRVHEFTKVELFAWTLPDDLSPENDDGYMFTPASNTKPPSQVLLDDMLALQKRVLAPLGLPLRVLSQPTHDLGASATCKYDIEAFFPSRTHAPWGELSSLSLCTDYQSRRLATKVRVAGGSRSVYPYTLNGTALAVPRVLAALLEHGWDEDRGVVRLPQCLWPWMGGLEEIRAPK